VVAAGGELLQCTHHFQALEWSSQEYTFSDDFCVLQLQNYAASSVWSLDWLAKHSPMVTHWAQQWLAFAHDGALVVLHGKAAGVITHALLELHLL
jgi:hypothetical protein